MCIPPKIYQFVIIHSCACVNAVVRLLKELRKGKIVSKRASGKAAMTPKGAPARKQAILALLRSEGFYSTLNLATNFGVSEMTIRRDILDLEQEGLARRVHGGATSINNGSLVPTDFKERTQLNFDRKVAIARESIAFISRGDIIAFDAGSTTLEIARLIPIDLSISVVTHSLPVINELTSRKNTNVYAIGGELHIPTQSFSSLDSANRLSDFRFTTFFLSAGSIRDGAVFCATPYEAVMKKAIIESSERVILVSDSTKFTSSAMLKVCELDRIDVIITDDQIPKKIASKISSYAKIQLITVPTRIQSNVE